MMNRHAQSGYTLLEVLIALLVFSIGLLGLAAMLVSAVRGNHQAYHHSQAVYVAEAMADGLRVNLEAVNDGSYNTAGLIYGHDDEDCSGITGCSAEDLANRDLSIWAAMANERLPNGRISVDCNSVGSPPTPLASGFRGICTLVVAWSETGDVGQTQASSDRTFTWMVQP